MERIEQLLIFERGYDLSVRKPQRNSFRKQTIEAGRGTDLARRLLAYF